MRATNRRVQDLGKEAGHQQYYVVYIDKGMIVLVAAAIRESKRKLLFLIYITCTCLIIKHIMSSQIYLSPLS